MEGCSCEGTKFGCCPDDVTAATGPKFEGCGCVSTEFKCCPDQFTPANGTGYLGCTCHTYEYGCCPDGKSIARGPGQEGCSCKDTEFGCCPDRKTPAQGPSAQGCGCAASRFGCCADGVNEATGEDFEGCDSQPPVPPPDVCGLPKDRGEEGNFTIRWFYDMEYGGCTRSVLLLPRSSKVDNFLSQVFTSLHSNNVYRIEKSNQVSLSFKLSTFVILLLLQSKPCKMFAATLQPSWPSRPQTKGTLLFYFLKLYNFVFLWNFCGINQFWGTAPMDLKNHDGTKKNREKIDFQAQFWSAFNQ